MGLLCGHVLKKGVCHWMRAFGGRPPCERGRESAAVLPGLKDGAEPWPIPLDVVWAGRALAGGRDIHEPTRVGQCVAKKRNMGCYTENQTVVGANLYENQRCG